MRGFPPTSRSGRRLGATALAVLLTAHAAGAVQARAVQADPAGDSPAPQEPRTGLTAGQTAGLIEGVAITPPHAESPRAADLVRLSERALRQTPRLSYDILGVAGGADAPRPLHFAGTVLIYEPITSTPLNLRLGMKGQVSGLRPGPADAVPDPDAAARAGQKVWSFEFFSEPPEAIMLRHSTKDIFTAENAESTATLGHQCPHLLISWIDLWADTARRAARDARGLSTAGTATIDGRHCHVVSFDFNDTTGQRHEVLWFLDALDRLPRRLESRRVPEGVQLSGAPGSGGPERRLLALDAAAVFTGVRVPSEQDADAVFRWTLPGDYELTKVAPEIVVRNTSVTPAGAAPTLGPLAPGAPAPEWISRDETGRLRRSSEFAGRAGVIVFVSRWSAEARRLERAVLDLAAQSPAGAAPLSVVIADCWSTPEPATQQHTPGVDARLLHAEGVAAAFGLDCVPSYAVLDPRGRIVATGIGFPPQREQDLRRAIDDATRSAR